jgi:hypothetical protein
MATAEQCGEERGVGSKERGVERVWLVKWRRSLFAVFWWRNGGGESKVGLEGVELVLSLRDQRLDPVLNTYRCRVRNITSSSKDTR